MTESLLRINLTREITWFQQFNPLSSTVVLSANVFESFPKAFIQALIRFDKPYLIDPITYILTDDDLGLTEKRWYSKLIGSYKLDSVLPTGDRVVTLSHLLNNQGQPTDGLRNLVANVIQYQRKRVIDSSELQVVKEIEEFEGRQVNVEKLTPRWLIAPYFLIDSDLEWLNANRQCLEEAIRTKQPNEKIFGVIALDESMLGSSGYADPVLSAYDIPGIDGYMIWISDFRETTQPVHQLRALAKFVENLARSGKPVYNMYGGLFSFLLANRGLTGSCHSICYGEYKDANAEGGGMIATIRYYDEKLRIKVPYGRLQEILNLAGRSRCDCDACRTLFEIAGDSPEDRGLKMTLCAKHFLYVRKKELDEINAGGIDRLIDGFNETFQAYRTADRYGSYEQFYSHLAVWRNALVNRE